MLYVEICPKVRRHNAFPFRIVSGRALCLLTLGHISAYNMDNTILLYKYIYIYIYIIKKKKVGFYIIYNANQQKIVSYDD